MTKQILKFRLHSLLDFSDPAVAEPVVSFLMGLSERFRPYRYGTYEPLKSKVTGNDAQCLVNGWLGIDDPNLHTGFKNVVFFMETKRGGRYLVRWGRSGLSTLGARFSFSRSDSDRFAVTLLEVVDHLAHLMQPEYGHVQDHMSRGGKIPYDLKIRLPDIPPVSIMGPAYIDFFGRDALMRAPYLKVSERDYGLWLEASENAFVEVPEERRKAIREFLGEDCFMAIPRKRYKKGRAPDFSTKPIKAPPGEGA